MPGRNNEKLYSAYRENAGCAGVDIWIVAEQA